MLSWIILFSIPGFPVNHLHTENLLLSFMLCNMIAHIQLPKGFIPDAEQYLKSLFAKKAMHLKT